MFRYNSKLYGMRLLQQQINIVFDSNDLKFATIFTVENFAVSIATDGRSLLLTKSHNALMHSVVTSNTRTHMYRVVITTLL